MKHLKFFLLLTLLLGAFRVHAELVLPDEFYVRQRWLSWTLTMDIESKDMKFGTVHRKFWSLRREYEFYDTDEVIQAVAKMRWFSFGAVFDVADSEGIPLGKIDEYLLTFFPKFDIVSPDDEVLSIAKLNFWGTKYTLRDPVTKEEMAILSRRFIRIVDNWTVRITDPELFASKNIDPRLFITVMALQTDRDEWSGEAAVIVLDCEKTQPEFLASSLQPTEEDFETIVGLVETEVGECEDATKYLEKLSSLEEDDALTLGQRKALYYLRHDHVSREKEELCEKRNDMK
ncbi:MAG: hypothetical protein K1000chlam4_00021 [Chlamydiae bacterium]|nr:hypothetical protein [Chlamydiota bacterium]